MRRDPADLASTRHDVLVIGGGIHGLLAAYDAASRGLSVALIERGDFGGGLSSHHQRTIHGGLRDVGALRVGKARRQIAERRAWARMAPHLIRPLPFLVGTYGLGARSRLALAAGFRVYDWLGRGRNDGVAPELHLPKSRLESLTTARRLFPGIATRQLTGGAVWYDYQTIHPDRLNWTVALAAMAAGARLANYVEAVGPLIEHGQVAGVRARDLSSGHEIDVPARTTLLAAGAGLPALHRTFGVTGAPSLVRAMNLLLARPAHDIAVAARGQSGRMLTAVPWRGLVLVGTFQSDSVIDPAEPGPWPAVDGLLADLNQTFPALSARAPDVRVVHHGLVPAATGGSRVELLSTPRVMTHTGDGKPNVFSLVGVKYTTARHAAELAIDAVSRHLGGRTGPCRTAHTSLPHAGIADVEGRLLETLRAVDAVLDRDVITHLTSWYGTEASSVVEFCAERQLLERVAPGSPVLAGEIAYAVEHAGALHLADVVFRRTPLGSAGHPGSAALARAAAVMGDVRGWSDDEQQRERLAVERIYP
jgi:glycerol-3-phosphate dehydrogenase